MTPYGFCPKEPIQESTATTRNAAPTDRASSASLPSWTQLDLDNGIWDLGFLGTKSERAKRTPLPRQTLAYLREAYTHRVSDEFVFLGRSLKTPMSNMTMLVTLLAPSN